MKSKSIIVIILGIIVMFGAYGFTKAIPKADNQTENIPKIEITPTSFDFGEAIYGDVLEHTFEVRNLGKTTLKINKVATSCACTTAKIEKETILPNEAVKLSVTYETGAMSGSHAKGNQERIIYIKSNDPINPQEEVIIYADVR